MTDQRQERPDIRADLRNIDDHGSWRQVRRAMHLDWEGGHE